MPRITDLDTIIRGLTPFMVTRPVICGAGRVGRGQKSEVPGFQMSQRADFVENEVGLETTFNRPIINTRDDPTPTPRSSAASTSSAATATCSTCPLPTFRYDLPGPVGHRAGHRSALGFHRHG